MMMKKLLSAALALGMALSLAACGGSKAPAAPAPSAPAEKPALLAPAAPAEPEKPAAPENTGNSAEAGSVPGYYVCPSEDEGPDWWVALWDEGEGYLYFYGGLEIRWTDTSFEHDAVNFYDYTLEGDTLTLVDGAEKLVFTRSTEEAFDAFLSEWADAYYEAELSWHADELYSAWNLYGGETEGWDWVAEDEGLHADIDFGYDEDGEFVASYYYTWAHGQMFCHDLSVDMLGEETWMGVNDGNDWHALLTGWGTEYIEDGDEHEVLVRLDVTIDPETDMLWCDPLVSYDGGEHYEGISVFYFVRGESVG